MPGFKYNPKTGMMEPKVYEEVRVYAVGGGAKVEDTKHHISFIIMRNSDTIQYTAGFDIRVHGVHFFNYKDAHMIADRIRRMMPQSKYGDFRYFLINSRDPEDEISEGNHAVNEVSSSGDDFFDLGASSTQGRTDFSNPNADRKKGPITTGVRGAIRALPSAIISTAICWPVALLNLVGSLQIRAQERWLHSMLNVNNWKDFIMTPAKGKSKPMTQREFDMLSQQEKEEYLRSQLKNNNRFFYAIQDNGDVFLVIGPHKTDAETLAEGIIGDLKTDGYYDKFQQKTDAGCHTYRVHLDNGEIISWVAADKKTAEQEVRDSRKLMQKAYSKIEKNFVNSDEFRNRPKYKGRMIDPTKLPMAEFTEDLGNVGVNKPDENNIRIEDHSIDIMENRGSDHFHFESFVNMLLDIRGKDINDAAKFVKELRNKNTIINIIDMQKKFLRNRDHKTYYIKVSCGDEFIVHSSKAEFLAKYPTTYDKLKKQCENSSGGIDDNELNELIAKYIVKSFETAIYDIEQTRNDKKIYGKRDMSFEGDVVVYNNTVTTKINNADKDEYMNFTNESDVVIFNDENTTARNNGEKETVSVAA